MIGARTSGRHLLPSFKGLRQRSGSVIMYLGCVGFVGYGAGGLREGLVM